MDKETKVALGLMMARFYQLQYKVDDSYKPVENGHLYGLLHGIESALDEEFKKQLISNQDFENVTNVLDSYKSEDVNIGAYDIESSLYHSNIPRWKIMLK